MLSLLLLKKGNIALEAMKHWKMQTTGYFFYISRDHIESNNTTSTKSPRVQFLFFFNCIYILNTFYFLSFYTGTESTVDSCSLLNKTDNTNNNKNILADYAAV